MTVEEAPGGVERSNSYVFLGEASSPASPPSPWHVRVRVGFVSTNDRRSVFGRGLRCIKRRRRSRVPVEGLVDRAHFLQGPSHEPASYLATDQFAAIHNSVDEPLQHVPDRDRVQLQA